MKTKNMAWIFTVLILITICFSPSLLAEDPPVPVLEEGDVVHFIETYPELSADLENLGMEYEPTTGHLTIPEAAQQNSELLSLLKKHGWDENFFNKVGVICLGYSILEYKSEVPEMDANVAKSIKEIEANPYMTEAQKKQMIERLKASRGIIASQASTMESKVHEQDLALIKPHMKELKEVLEDD
ncbi:MAG: hypothetical protein JXB26_06630 [Candidatus Aminicenantes bacterium]|nr:hypothetical protein [Candidatus Aminicenantes bacterium]